MKNERIAIISGLRTPMAKSGGKFKNLQADALGARLIRELMMNSKIGFDEVDEVIIGNVSQPIHAANIARVISLRAGFPESTPAMTVNRNCASGMQSITSAAAKIHANEGKIYLCGGVESMSNIPFIFNKNMTGLFVQLSKSKTYIDRAKTIFGFRPAYLKPIIGLMSGLTDPVSGLMMGSTAEILVRDFGISRVEQDEFSLQSHEKALLAKNSGRFAQESTPIVYDEINAEYLDYDDGIREGLSLEKLSRLKPFFDRKNGTVTAANSSQVTDAAAAVILMSESEAKSRGLTPLGYLTEYSYQGLDPKRMGLGPVFATHDLFSKTGLSMNDMDLIEINEAFASQVIACQKAFASKAFAKTHFGEDKAIGAINPNILNVNGGSIALGHPVGMTGTRLVITLLHELKNRNLQRGLATLCIGGGQGVALLLEAE
ncbi:fatty acid oxidation complex subunit beta [Sulfurimonas gotlandica GD1]|uniref:Fatty acid oxidation complex subunit beta n=1 Tax=Sulfurimonas gotlandica (strain DSM 19862 / JCM 16533 / GD1) TaxID=929558 RepID=B6BLQ5_SULGG|nr:thiolase family protein [Sulfurimonas gotlandica]EDZ61984.1 3-ketoacyl-CoA thiolase [Sulfurimonas gotlandica GD1]EHP28715.1 fatty acid oxidation complex subunit beta [Sulfurimonas gotlandica GD1]